MENEPIITYMKTPIHSITFKNKRVKKWVEEHCGKYVLNLFAGDTKLDVNEIRNDLDPDKPADYHMDALDLCQMFYNLGMFFDTVILDPPYSYRKSMEYYNENVASRFRQIKDLLTDIVIPEGKVITLGYHSVVMGRNRKFVQEEILLLSHGGAIHDTIGVVERKVR